MKRNELTANLAMAARVERSGWTVGRNFAARKTVTIKRTTFTEYLKKRGIIAFKQSAGSV